MIRGGVVAVGYREDDGALFMPQLVQLTDILSFSREEAFNLISAPEKPLAGHSRPPQLQWLPEPEQCRRETFLGSRPLDPDDAYLALFRLLNAFKRVEKRLKKKFTNANLMCARSLESKAAAYLHELKKARTTHIYEGRALQSSLANVERDRKRFAHIAEAIEIEIKQKEVDIVWRMRSEWEKKIGRRRQAEQATAGWKNPDALPFELVDVPRKCKNLEEFVRGPLADCYEHLFGRRPGRKYRTEGPFIRFAERFLELVGHSAARGTIASALKGRSPTKA